MRPYTPLPPAMSPRVVKSAVAVLVVAGALFAASLGVEPLAGALYGVLPACTVQMGGDQSIVAQVRGVNAGTVCANAGGSGSVSVVPDSRVNGLTGTCTVYKNGNRIRLYTAPGIGMLAVALACPALGNIVSNT